jgi:hypothetical protein
MLLKNKKPSWQFTVSSVEDVDVKRILRETPPDVAWVIITDRFGAPVLLCIRTAYLRQFSPGDRIRVCNEYLSERWGGRRVPYFDHDRGCLTVLRNASTEPYIDDWRVPTNYMCSLLSTDSVCAMINADKYIRRVPVRVYTSSDLLK